MIQPDLPQPSENGTHDLDGFCQAMLSRNPFTVNRVNGLTEDSVDVEEIHAAEFERLKNLALEARDLRRGLGVMLWGEAGIGKSHLLARLERWGKQVQKARVIYLHNLQSSPENLARSVLKIVVGHLTCGRSRNFARTPLAEYLHAFVGQALQLYNGEHHAWAVVDTAYRRFVDQLSLANPARFDLVDRVVYGVLYHFYRSMFRAHKTLDDSVAKLAVTWLAGDFLDPKEAKLLGLSLGRNPDESVGLADNQEVKKVLVALSQLALSVQQPFVLCFDQVDNLDDEQAAALSRFLEALLDSAPNLLVVTAGIKSSLLHWREIKVFQDSAWDRLAQFEVALHRLTALKSRELITSRVEKALQPFLPLHLVRQLTEQDSLFPLGQAWADQFFQDKIELRPRQVLSAACEGWQRQQETLSALKGLAWLETWGKTVPPLLPPMLPALSDEQFQKAVDQKVAENLAARRAQARRQPGCLPTDAGQFAGVLLTLLKQCGELEIERPPSGTPNVAFPYNFLVRRDGLKGVPEATTAVLIICNTSAISTAATLRWLAQATSPVRLLLVTEERSPLKFGSQRSPKGRSYYEELRRRGPERFRHLDLTFEQYVELNALQTAVVSAGEGALEIDLPGYKPRVVQACDVIASNHRQDRYRSTPVLRELFHEPALATQP